MQPHSSLRGVEKFLRVVADAVLENKFCFLDIADVSRRIAFYHDQVGRFAGSNRPDALVAEVLGAVEGGDLDGFQLRESRFDQQLDPAPVAITGNHAAAASRIESGDEQIGRASV